VLNFRSGIAALSDAQSEFNRNLAHGFSASIVVYDDRHNITLGGDLHKQQFNDGFSAGPARRLRRAHDETPKPSGHVDVTSSSS
jgi:hypothetical protein